jgi:long-chain acyl-CoA synthetase
VGLLARRLDIPVVPLRIDGLFDLKVSGRKIARRGELKVMIGKPLRFSPETPAEEITSQLEHVTWSL